jgi:ribosome-binding protein aMBF1 (putative translation factor)
MPEQLDQPDVHRTIHRSGRERPAPLQPADRSQATSAFEAEFSKWREVFVPGHRIPGSSPAERQNSTPLDDTHFLQTIGSAIRDLRDARGMTQAQLAEECGLHRTFIGWVERGEWNVAILNLRRIAKSLRVSLAELLAGTKSRYG